jgi:hypothetical protein
VPPDVRTGCEPTGGSVDRKSGEPVEKTFEGDRCLEARRGGAETVVGAVSETQGPHDGLCCIECDPGSESCGPCLSGG